MDYNRGRILIRIQVDSCERKCQTPNNGGKSTDSYRTLCKNMDFHNLWWNSTPVYINILNKGLFDWSHHIYSSHNLSTEFSHL